RKEACAVLYNVSVLVRFGAINDVVFEINNDAKMKRTSRRPLPSGRITIPHAVGSASSVGLADLRTLWAAASNDISLNAMILPVALYFWKIPHFMALAYLCRDDFAAGGFKMYSLADASGHRISLVALGNSMYLIPLGFLAYDCE
ncbi:Protoheme IX farnesyltransferase, mitochondrial, partial [Glycine soja]